MTKEEKLNILRTLLGETDSDVVLDSLLEVAGREIISWRFSSSPAYASISEVPAEYEMVQVYAVVAGFSQRGAEAQIAHSENGIARNFSYPDMLHYIHSNVIPYCGVF